MPNYLNHAACLAQETTQPAASRQLVQESIIFSIDAVDLNFVDFNNVTLLLWGKFNLYETWLYIQVFGVEGLTALGKVFILVSQYDILYNGYFLALQLKDVYKVNCVCLTAHDSVSLIVRTCRTTFFFASSYDNRMQFGMFKQNILLPYLNNEKEKNYDYLTSLTKNGA